MSSPGKSGDPPGSMPSAIKKHFDHFGCNADATIEQNVETLANRLYAATRDGKLQLTDLMNGLQLRKYLLSQITGVSSIGRETIDRFVIAMWDVLERKTVLSDATARTAIVTAFLEMHSKQELYEGISEHGMDHFEFFLNLTWKALEACVARRGEVDDVLAAIKFIGVGQDLLHYPDPTKSLRALLAALNMWRHDELVARAILEMMRRVFGDGDYGTFDERVAPKVDSLTHQDAVAAVLNLFLPALTRPDAALPESRLEATGNPPALNAAFEFLLERAEEYAMARSTCDCARDHAIADAWLVAFNRSTHLVVRWRIVDFLRIWSWQNVDRGHYLWPRCREVHLTTNGFMPALIDYARSLIPIIAAYIPKPEDRGPDAAYMGCHARMHLVETIDLLAESIRESTCEAARDGGVVGVAFASLIHVKPTPKYFKTRYDFVDVDAVGVVRYLVTRLHDDRVPGEVRTQQYRGDYE